MNKLSKIILIIIVSLSCSDRTDRKIVSTVLAKDTTSSSSVEMNNESVKDSSNVVIISRFQENLNRMKLDTILQGDIHLVIMPVHLDTYVTQEWTKGDTLYRDNYYDLAYKLKIKKKDKVLIDTTFTKQNVIAKTDEEFKNKAHFIGYWLDKYTGENELVIFGNICQPDTDWCIFFNHRIDTNTGEVKFIIPES